MDKKPDAYDPKKALRMVFGNNPDQHILNVVRESCREAFSLPSFNTTLQTIKSHFYDRNYDAVFQNPEHLPVYSARYAPSRALCYYHLFLEHPVLMKILEGGPSTILCIGSGAGSELVGITAAMVHANPALKIKKKKVISKTKDKVDLQEEEDGQQVVEHGSEACTPTESVNEEAQPPQEATSSGKGHDNTLGMEKLSVTEDTADAATTTEELPPPTKSAVKKKGRSNRHQVTIVMQDYVDWSPILTPMEEVIRRQMALGSERLKCETEVGNVLDLSQSLLERIARADLITFMFVLNELFQDKKRTMLLVAKIVAAMPSGAHMLVVDSAGSFSNLQVGERVYMVYMLLDHLRDLEIVYQDDSTWYRCPPTVTYPLKLENMRHFIRIYKKL
ncbi:hypothetical protein BGW38_001931 [Lunasporangiospora selenospora]|uniref:Uncharacterized protein n=1 Tax=Lunasporangiospora selenospora TaxID=979761 RepID=A0A9P6G3F8_9FUNG|nr:hypothetical protein BGW38_001931 [Lunasporangiospora selenospora]